MSQEEVAGKQIETGNVAGAIFDDYVLLKGIADILYDPSCTEGCTKEHEEIRIRSMSLWALSRFTEQTLESLHARANAAQRRTDELLRQPTEKGKRAAA